MIEFFKNILITLGIIASPVLGVNSTVPMADGPGYMLVSTTTGAWVATTTDPLSVGSLNSTSTATSTFNGGIQSTCFSISGASCIVSGSTLIGAGSTGEFPFYASVGRTLTATSSIRLSLTTGNIGIGTALGAGAKLEVNGNMGFSTGADRTISFVQDSSNVLTLEGGGGFSTPPGDLKILGGSDADTGTPGGDVFVSGGYGNSNGFVILGHNGTEVTNNVGVGTTSPWAQLSVEAGGSAPKFVVSSPSAVSLIVAGSGNVGVGTTSPSSELGVNGAVTASRFIATSLTSTSTFTGIQFTGTFTTSGTKPTVSAGCGTSPVVWDGSTNNWGIVQIGTGGTASTCTLTFAATPKFVRAPACFVNNNNSNARANIASSTPTTVVFSQGAAWTAGHRLSYHCLSMDSF